MHQQVTIPRPAGRKKKHWKRWVVLLALAVGVAAYFLWPKAENSTEVTSEKAAIRDLTQLVAATGKIRPRVEVKISPEVAGEIIELPVVNGQRVKKGDLLVKIKPDPYIAAVQQAEATMSAAQATCLQNKAQMLNDQLDLHRAEDLYRKRIDSDQDFRTAQTKSSISQAQYESSLHQIDVAKSALDQQKTLLDKCVIFAPMDGTVSMLESEPGERVVATNEFAGTEVMRIANLSAMEARVDANENDVVNVAVGDPVRVDVDAYPNHPQNGVVRQIATTATIKGEGTQQEVTNFEVRITIEHPDVELRPGMSVSVAIETETVHHVVSIPIQSVTVRSRENGKTPEQMKTDREKDQPGVTVADSDKRDERKLERVVFLRIGDVVKMVPVRTGIADDNYIQIVSGIKAGDEVITGSYTAISKDLKDGAKVTTAKPKPTK